MGPDIGTIALYAADPGERSPPSTRLTAPLPASTHLRHMRLNRRDTHSTPTAQRLTASRS